MIYVVASQQDLHLAQLFKIEELMGRKDISDKCQHINFGMVLGMISTSVPHLPTNSLTSHRYVDTKRHGQVP
jgi:hypothetical protein